MCGFICNSEFAALSTVLREALQAAYHFVTGSLFSNTWPLWECSLSLQLLYSAFEI